MAEESRIVQILRRVGYQAPPPYEWAIGTAMNVSCGGPWIAVLARVRFGHGAPPASRRSLCYPEVQLWEGSIDAPETWDALSHGSVRPLEFGRARVLLQEPNWNAHYSPTEHWPHWLIRYPCYFASTSLVSQLPEGLQVDHPRGLEHLPVAMDGERAYANALSACQDWFDLSETLQSDNARLRTLEVVLPLPQGYVRRLEQDVQGQLIVLLVPGLDNRQLKVRVAWDEHGTPYEHSAEADNDGALFDVVPPGAFTVYVFYGEQLLTHYHGDGRRILHPDLTLESEVRAVVLDGESESSEFKELSDKGMAGIRSLSDKILRTVCGMANTSGGYFLLGVSDDSKVLGLDQALVGFQGKTEAEKREALVREVKKLLRTRLPDAPQVSFSWVHLDGKTILALDIHRCTPGHPCSIDGREILVRRGSSTRAPLPGELRDLLSDSFG